jgi:hypothetical protein
MDHSTSRIGSRAGRVEKPSTAKPSAAHISTISCTPVRRGVLLRGDSASRSIVRFLDPGGAGGESQACRQLRMNGAAGDREGRFQIGRAHV